MNARFFLCRNPLATFPEGLISHVYHARKPRFMSALFSIDANKPIDINYDGLNLLFRYVRGDGYEQMYVLILTDIIDRATTTKLVQTLEQAVAWYVTCIGEEDVKIYAKESFWTLLSDYSTLMPGVKLLHIKKPNALLLCYPGGVRTFASREAVNTFLNKSLNYPETLMNSTTVTLYERKPV